MIDGTLEEQAEFIEGLLGIDEERCAGLAAQTKLVHGYSEPDPKTGSVSFPIYPSATFAHPSLDGSTGFMYSRCGNPTRLELENTIAMLEGGCKAFAFASGMAAISCLVKLFEAGDHILVSDDLYGGTYRLFADIYAKFGLDFDFVDFTDLASVERAIRPATKALFVETPTNPMMKVVDLDAMSALCRENEALLVVDNTLMTPYFQRPFEHGADIVVHSGTKYLCGHNDITAGFLVLKDSRFLLETFNLYMSEGGLLSPQDSWLLLRSLKTLSVRLDRQQENAKAIFEYLRDHPHVTDVYYAGDPDRPSYSLMQRQADGFGAMISFRVDEESRLVQALERVKVILYAESLGGVESLMTYPLMQTHSAMPEEVCKRLGIDERLLRLSVGIEALDDLISDLEVALS